MSTRDEKLNALPDHKLRLLHELTEAKRLLQRALDDLRMDRDLGLVAEEAQRAADRVSTLVKRYHREAELDADHRLVLWHIQELYALNERGCTYQELQRKVRVRVKDLKAWTKELIRLGLVRKERLGSRLVPGERHFDFWRRTAA